MFKFHRAVRRSIAVAAVSVLLLPPVLEGADHVVPISELRRQVDSISSSRIASLAKVQKFLSSDAASTALKRSGLDSARVARAAATLSNEELAHLSARAAHAEQDLAAGALSNQELTYIVIALATAVVILVIINA